MADTQETLALLCRKIARIDRKYAQATPPAPRQLRPHRYFVEEIASGEVVRTAWGEHFECEKIYERHRRHGSVDISDLLDLPPDLLKSLSGEAIADSHPTRWAFLDTETTGLAGGAGVHAFLIGVGSIDTQGFRVRQFFMRDYGEESSLLGRLTEHLSRFDVLITYNGKTYDQPLLESRFRMLRSCSPFERMPHVDLLHGARSLWKLRLDRCRLVDLEYQILGVERDGDLPGELIPYCYFEYLRTQQALKLIPIFHHNVMDIVTLACLTATVPMAFQKPQTSSFHHGADILGLGRWLMKAERHEEALALFRRAIDQGLPDHLLFQAMWEISQLEKRMGRQSAALPILRDLAGCRNPYRAKALEELAKHYEHRDKNYPLALEMTRNALALGDSPEIRRREQRLLKRLAGRHRE